MKNIQYKFSVSLVAFLSILFCSATFSNNCDLVVKVKGSKVHGVYSHFKVLVNDLPCGEDHTSSEFEDYCFNIPFASAEISEIKIVFDNDLYTIGEDRNLCVHSLIIHNDIPIRANQETAQYTCINGDVHSYCGMMLWNGSLVFDVARLRFHPGNVTLTSQKEVNAFSSQYVDGNLTISGEDITNLSPLSGLVSIKGALIIENNPGLIQIDGFNSVIKTGFISIQNNPKLLTIDGFSTLEQCVGMHIRRNDSLEAIKCFHSRTI